MEHKDSQMPKKIEAEPLSICREKELIYLSKDASGYTREEAVRALANFPSKEVVEALVLRTNDWVPIIRHLAKETLSEMLSESSAIHYAKNLSRIYHLRQCGRSEHSDFVREIEGQLSQYPDALAETVKLSSSGSTKLSAKLLAKSKSLSKKTLAGLCFESLHEGTRQYAVSLLSQSSDTDISKLRKLVVSDKSARVRTEAFRKLVRIDQQETGAIAKQLMFDASPGLRSAAIFQLKKSCYDCIGDYTKELNSDKPRTQKIAIWGLMELFSKSSLSEILCKLDSLYPSVRLQALRACYVFSEEAELVNILKRTLVDESPKIVKESARVLEKISFVVSLDDYKDIILRQKYVKVYSALLRATHKMNKWQQLIFLSELSLVANKALASDVEKIFIRWVEKMSNFFVDPTKDQVIEIKKLDSQSTRLWHTSIKRVVAERFALCGQGNL